MRTGRTWGLLGAITLFLGCLGGNAWAQTIHIYGGGGRNNAGVQGNSAVEAFTGDGVSFRYSQAGSHSIIGTPPLSWDTSANWTGVVTWDALGTGTNQLFMHGGSATGDIDMRGLINTINNDNGATTNFTSSGTATALGHLSGNSTNTITITGGSASYGNTVFRNGTNTINSNNASSFGNVTMGGGTGANAINSTGGLLNITGSVDMASSTGNNSIGVSSGTLTVGGDVKMAANGSYQNNMTFNNTTTITGNIQNTGNGANNLGVGLGVTTNVNGTNGISLGSGLNTTTVQGTLNISSGDFVGGNGGNTTNISGSFNISSGDYTGGSGTDIFKVLNSSGVNATIAGTMDLGHGSNTVDLAGGNTHIGAYQGGSGYDQFSTTGSATLTVDGNIDLGSSWGGTGNLSLNGGAAIISGDIFGAGGGNTFFISTNTTLIGTLTSGFGADYLTVDFGDTFSVDGIDLSGGNNVFEILGTLDSTNSLIAGSDNDYFHIGGAGVANVTGDINLGAGTNDFIIDGALNLTGDVIAFSGDDTFIVNAGGTANITGDLDLGGGNNNMVMDGAVTVDGNIHTDGGNDSLTVAAGKTTTVNGAGGVNLGEGNDKLTVGSGGALIASSGDIILGNGTNTAELYGNVSTKGGTGTISSGIDNDTWVIGSNSVSPTISASVDTGAGNDSFTFSGGQITGTATIGDGQNTVLIEGPNTTVTKELVIGNGLGTGNTITITGGDFGAGATGDALNVAGGINKGEITGGTFHSHVTINGTNNTITIDGNVDFQGNLTFGNGVNSLDINAGKGANAGIAGSVDFGSNLANVVKIHDTDIALGIKGNGASIEIYNNNINANGIVLGAASNRYINIHDNPIVNGGVSVDAGNNNTVTVDNNTTITGNVMVGAGTGNNVVVTNNTTITGNVSVGATSPNNDSSNVYVIGNNIAGSVDIGGGSGTNSVGREIAVSNGSVGGPVNIGNGDYRTIDIYNNTSIGGNVAIGQGTNSNISVSDNTVINGNVEVGKGSNANDSTNVAVKNNQSIVGKVDIGGGESRTVDIDNNANVALGIEVGDSGNQTVKVDRTNVAAGGIKVGNGDDNKVLVNRSTVTAGGVNVGNGMRTETTVANSTITNGGVTIGIGADKKTVIDNTTIAAGGLNIRDGDRQFITIKGSSNITGGVTVGNSNPNNGQITYDLNEHSIISGDFAMGTGNHIFQGVVNAEIIGDFGKSSVTSTGKIEAMLENGTILGNVTLGNGDNLFGITPTGDGWVIGNIDAGIGNDRLMFYNGAVTGDINVGGGRNTLHFVNNTMNGNITDDNSANGGGLNGTNEILFSGNAGSYSNGVITMSNGKNVTTIQDGFNMEGGRAHTYGDAGNKFYFYDGIYGMDGNNVDFTSGNGDDLFVFDGNRNGANTNMFLDVTSQSGHNQWYIQSGTLQGTLNAQNGANYFEQTGGIITKDSSQSGGLVLIEGHNAQNEYYLTGTGIVAPDGEIQVTTTASRQSGSTFYFHQDAGTFSGTLYSYGPGGAVNNDTRNIIHFIENANFTRSAMMHIDGIDNEVLVDLASSANDFAGYIDMTRSIGNNHVQIKNGNLTNNIDGSFHGSNNLGSNTYYWVTGGETWQTYGGRGGSHLDMYAGNVWNHQGNNIGSSRELPTGVDVDNMNTAKFYNEGDYHMYSLLNIDHVELSGKANLTIGKLNGNGNPDNPLGSRAQITANQVDVHSGSRLRIHEDRTQFSLNGAPYTPGNSDPSKQYANIINEMNITGSVTIDRTTIQGTNPGEAVINVAGGGILHGFTRKESTNFWDGAPNLIGNVNLYSGSILRPYDSSIFDIVNPLYRGAVFEVQADPGTGKGGVATFYGGSTLSTRLFADPDGKSIAINGQQTTTSYSDSLKSLDVDFSSIGPKPADKVQYDPIFGYRNELKSKLDYLIYHGDGTLANDNTYYGTVVESSVSIPELAGYDDANHLFNREILKSDMLGEWWFEKATSNVTDDSVVVRFRLLAAHPADGGIAKVMKEPNARNAANMIDIIRYPFQNDYNHLSPAVDPTYAGSTSSDPTVYAPHDGYNGNMREFYAEAYKQNPEIYSNYNDKYIQDWENLLLGMQKSSISAGVLNEDVRQLHPEAYASMVNINLRLMEQFNQVREQHAISSLYQVESDLYNQAAIEAAQYEGAMSGTAYANVDDACDIDIGNMFVQNPIRFWASGFGTKGNQKKDGHEYGYDADIWGGALGVVKECGDWYFGLTGGYARVDADWDDLRATVKNDAYMAQAMVGLRRGMGFIEAFGNYAYNNQTMTRDINITSYSGVAKGDYADHVYGGGIRMGYQWVINNQWLVVPSIGVNYTRSENGSFAETGRAYQSTLLRFGSGDIKRNVIKTPISVRLSRPFALGCYVLTPEVRAAFTPIFGNRYAKATTEFVGNPVPGLYFEARGVDNGRYTALLGASLELSRRGRFFLSGNYDYTFRRKSHEHNYSVQTGVNF